jgi:hypothetical protein
LAKHGCSPVPWLFGQESFQDTLSRQVRNLASLGLRVKRPDPGSRCGEQVLIGPVTVPAIVWKSAAASANARRNGV